MTRRIPAYALLGLLAVALSPVSGTVAYIGQNPYVVQLKAPAHAVSCADEVVITATVRSSDTGELVGHQAVSWDVKTSPSASDSLSQTNSVTNDKGKTRVTLHFGPAEGQRTVRATIATWPATIEVTCAGGLPTPAPTPVATPTPTHPTVNPPSSSPSLNPTATPTASPTGAATLSPSAQPTPVPTVTPAPTTAPSATPVPAVSATPAPSVSPTPGPDADSTLGAGLLPIAFIVLVGVGLGVLVLVARRR